MTSIYAALQEGIKRLTPYHQEARLEAELLLSHVIKHNRSYLYAHSDAELNNEHLSSYLDLLEQRISGTPIAYLTQKRDFWNLSLKVTRDTLIPRHETELLIELILELIPNIPNTQVLDLGTGSGAIALAIAKERPLWQVDACDISLSALEIAKVNATMNHITNVEFYHSDWFKMLPVKQYDVIVANPPYIAENDPHLSQGDVRFEPIQALVSGQEGLADLQYIINKSFTYLKPKGLLLLEHGYDQKLKVLSIIKQLGYINSKCWKDLQGNDRVSGGYRPELMSN